VAVLIAVAGGAASGTVVALGTVAAPDDDIPVVTANPFIPENQDLTTCVGLLPRPGCGSEARGGPHQYLVAGAMVGGLALIFGRVAWGVHRNRRRPEESSTPSEPPTAAPTPTSSRAVGPTP
jgi:hypothetical protein